MIDCFFCSNLFLVALFYGISYIVLRVPYYFFPGLYFVLHLIGFFIFPFSAHLELFYHITLGLLVGLIFVNFSKGTSISPKKWSKQPKFLILLLGELTAFVLVVFGIDDIVPDSEYPVGVVMSIIFYNLWFIFAYNINYRNQEMIHKPYPEIHSYNQTWITWYLSLLGPLLLATLPVNFTVLTTLLGLFLSLVFIFLQRGLCHTDESKF